MSLHCGGRDRIYTMGLYIERNTTTLGLHRDGLYIEVILRALSAVVVKHPRLSYYILEMVMYKFTHFYFFQCNNKLKIKS